MRSFLLILFLLLLLLLVVTTFAGYGKKIATYVPNTKALTTQDFNSFSWMHGNRIVDKQVNAPVALLTQKKG